MEGKKLVAIISDAASTGKCLLCIIIYLKLLIPDSGENEVPASKAQIGDSSLINLMEADS